MSQSAFEESPPQTSPLTYDQLRRFGIALVVLGGLAFILAVLLSGLGHIADWMRSSGLTAGAALGIIGTQVIASSRRVHEHHLAAKQLEEIKLHLTWLVTVVSRYKPVKARKAAKAPEATQLDEPNVVDLETARHLKAIEDRLRDR